MCRVNVQINDLIHEHAVMPEIGVVYNDKVAALDAIITYMQQDKETHRVIIFSEFGESYKFISKTFEDHNVKCASMTGTGTSIRKRIFEWEQTKRVECIFLNARTYGAGLNLQAATDIILWHSISSGDLHRQVIGRVVRMGMKTPPTLWRIHYKHEVQRV